MPIIGAESIKQQIYRISVYVGDNVVENIVVTPDGLYNINYIKAGKLYNKSGKIINIVQNKGAPQNSYIVFDPSEILSNKHERILFYQVQTIRDITPNDAYAIAVKHGFEGSVDDWLKSLKGSPGKSAYELAVECGYVGTLEQWLQDLKGKDAYQIAVEEYGYVGTREQWMAAMGDVTVVNQKIEILEPKVNQHEARITSLEGRADTLESATTWIHGMPRPTT